MSCFQSHPCEVFFTWVFVCHCVNTVNTRLIPVKPTRLKKKKKIIIIIIIIKLNNILIIIIMIVIKLVKSLKRVNALFAVTSPFVWLCNK